MWLWVWNSHYGVFAANRQIYLLCQNGATRLPDSRKLIGPGLNEVDWADAALKAL